MSWVSDNFPVDRAGMMNHDRAGRARTSRKVREPERGSRVAVVEIICIKETGNEGEVADDQANIAGLLVEEHDGRGDPDDKHRVPRPERHATVPDIQIRCINKGNKNRNSGDHHRVKYHKQIYRYISYNLCMAIPGQVAIAFAGGSSCRDSCSETRKEIK